MTSPLRSQMMEAAGLALSAWQVRLRGSPARRLITGPPRMMGSSGGTVGRGAERSGWGRTLLDMAEDDSNNGYTLIKSVTLCITMMVTVKGCVVLYLLRQD